MYFFFLLKNEKLLEILLSNFNTKKIEAYLKKSHMLLVNEFESDSDFFKNLDLNRTKTCQNLFGYLFKKVHFFTLK